MVIERGYIMEEKLAPVDLGSIKINDKVNIPQFHYDCIDKKNQEFKKSAWVFLTSNEYLFPKMSIPSPQNPA